MFISIHNFKRFTSNNKLLTWADLVDLTNQFLFQKKDYKRIKIYIYQGKIDKIKNY